MIDLADLEVAARVPLVMAPASACRQKIRPGQVIRVFDRREPLLGYHMACAKCGFRASYNTRETTYVEEPIFPDKRYPLRLVDIQNPPRCYQCFHLIAVRDGFLVALVPSGGAHPP